MKRGLVAVALFSLALPELYAAAQGVTTSGIVGRATAADGSRIDGRVYVVHEGTGAAVEVRVSHDRFLVQGLEPGGPYTVSARALGFAPEQVRGIHLALGELRELRLLLQPVAARLDTLAVVARAGGSAHGDGGTGTTISDAQLERLPTLNRDLYDFLRLVPQLSTRIALSNPGISAAGMSFRLNNFLVNGVSERTHGGGVSSAFNGNRSVPLEAVREYQVLLSPYDVRYGDFVGALVNTVTKSGTNELRGSAFAYGRSDRLGRGGSLAPATSYERGHFGLSLGGPIVRDRLHFFVAPELQQFTNAVRGPYVGQPFTATPPVPVSGADVERFDAIMRGYGLTAGSAGAMEIAHPLRNLFTRLDLALPRANSRVVVWDNWGAGDDDALSRASRDTFTLSSYAVTRRSRLRASAVHLHTALGRAGGGHGELLLSRRSDRLNALGAVTQPIVRVSVPSVSGGRITLNSGTHETAQSSPIAVNASAVKANLTLPFGDDHVVTVGAELERFHIRPAIGAGSYGTWSFANLDDLAAGIADRYEVRVGYLNTARELRGAQYAAFVGDQWQPTDRLSLTGGVRADLLAVSGRAPAQPLIDSIFGRRTDEMPRPRVELSPRLGFVWDVAGAGEHRLRGGIGIFAGRYPLAWVTTALSSYGAASGLLRCSATEGPLRQPPPFSPDYRSAPAACRGGTGLSAGFGDVDLLDPDLRMARIARATLAYERRLPSALLLTNEVLVTRALSDFAFVNLNLADPLGTDPHGRVMYGTIGSNGTATPRTRSGFSEVIDLRNVSGTRAWSLSTRLETTRPAGVGGSASYTYSRARDVQTALRILVRGTQAWASARVVSGRQDDLSATRSSNDIPHRVILAGTYTAPWRRLATSLAFYYVGESGRPFTYLATGTLGLGDLNADGSNANDPIYVPRDAMDSTEILFSGVSTAAGADTSPTAQASRELSQRQAFRAFVERTSCLRRRRGRILERNACREPWTNTTNASLRQSIPVWGRTLEAQLDVFNVLNLLNAAWGLRREAAPALLEHVGQIDDASARSRPVFRYDDSAPVWTTVQEESAFQLQLALRYRF